MAVDPADPKMAGFVPLNEDWAADCPSVATRRIRDESHFLEALPAGAPLPAASNDAAAAIAGVKLYGFYQNAGVLRQRMI